MTNERTDEDARIDHRYVDTSFTFGDTLLLTLGGGTGVGESTGKANDWFIGPALAMQSFEVYWIHRRNWVTTSDGVLGSRHFQLGLGWRI